jgi:hypothetical protein
LATRQLRLWGGIAATVAGVAAVAGVYLMRGRSPAASRPLPAPPAGEVRVELPPIRASVYLNTQPDAEFVGTAACAECHADAHATYRATPHSEALLEISTERSSQQAPFELATQFTHEASQRHLESYVDQEKVWHRVAFRPPSMSETLEVKHPLRFEIGSGHHSRSYLAEADGFLVESPITWYASRERWGMSPGYDRPFHDDFERLADFGCVYCHAGRVEPLNGERFRFTIHEATIGCESCHGPGGLHVQRHEAGAAEGAEDVTIVHPGRLPRELQEALCAQCHLRGAASISVRGRGVHHFRPGLQLSDFRVDYIPAAPDQAMKVVGHAEQMRHSACYQQSAMTCISCHDPHAAPQVEMRIAFYRDKCLACHGDGCELAEPERLSRSPDNDCVSCHMPKTDTDIPHIAFTHHRIAVHHQPPPVPGERTSELITLVPLGDVSHLSQADRDRCLGLAYLEIAETAATRTAQAQYHERARKLMESAYADGLRDAALLAGLARIAWERKDLTRALELGTAALSEPDFGTGAHPNALVVVGDCYRQLGDYASAALMFEKLVKLRRRSEDWYLLGVARANQRQLPQAIAAFQQALQINPLRPHVHQLLAEMYNAQGDAVLARRHFRWAHLLP